MLRTLLSFFALLPAPATADLDDARVSPPGAEALFRSLPVHETTRTAVRELVEKAQPAFAPRACPEVAPSHARLGDYEPHTQSFGRAPTPRAVTIGISDEATTTLSFGWKTDHRTLASQAQLRRHADEPPVTIDGFSFNYRALERTGRRMHEVAVCNLPAATTLEYRVGGGDAWSDWHPVRTLIPPGSPAPYTVVIAGDSRSSMRVFGEIGDAILAHKPDAVFFTGDLVGDGRNQARWDPWFAAGEALFRSTIFIPILGNHEYDAVNYFGQFMLPGDERNFSLDIGEVTWSVFDDDGGPTRVETLVRPRLAALLARTAPRDRWMLLHHRPVYSASGRGSNRVRRTHLLELFEWAMPDAIFTAHVHNYERSCKIAADACVDPNEPGTFYITTAGAGANLVPAGRRWFTEVSNSIFHYVVLEIEGTKIDAKVYALSGEIIDAFEFPPVFSRAARPSVPPSPSDTQNE